MRLHFFGFESTFRENSFISHRNIDHFELFKYVFVFCHTQLALLFFNLFYIWFEELKYLNMFLRCHEFLTAIREMYLNYVQILTNVIVFGHV